MLSQSQFRSVRNYLRVATPDWERVARDARIRVVDPQWNKELYHVYVSRGYRLLYRNARVAVFDARR